MGKHARMDRKPMAHGNPRFSHAANVPRSLEIPTRRKRPIARVVQWVAGIVFVVCLVALGFFAAQYLIQSSNYDKLEKNVTFAVNDIEQTDVKLADLNVDWEALRQVNPEIVGWLYIPGTVVNYPVVQAEDNEKYLDTSFDGTTGWLASKGCLFLDCTNEGDFGDQNNGIYGHHMRDGSMFAVIDDFSDQEVFDEHRAIFYLTPKGNYRLTTFAQVITDGSDEIVQTGFASEDDYRAYIQDKIDRSVVKQNGQTITANSVQKSLLLSTCDYTREDGRAILFASVVETTVPDDPYVEQNLNASSNLNDIQASDVGKQS